MRKLGQLTKIMRTVFARKNDLTTKEVANLASWCCSLCKTQPPDSLSLDLVGINDQFCAWKATTRRLPLQLSSNLRYLKCTRDPERWLVLSSANCQPTELIRTVKTRTAGSHSTDWLTKWWKEVCWWAISATQDSSGFWIIILRDPRMSAVCSF